MKKHVLILILVISQTLSSFTAYAEIILYTNEIQTPDQMKILTRTYSKILAPKEVQNSFEYLKTNPLSLTQKKKLLQMLADAEEASYQGHFVEALETFETLLKQLQIIPNVAGIESIRQRVLIKKAELKTLTKMADAGLAWRDAVAWSPEIDINNNQYNPDTKRILTSLKNSSETELTIQLASQAYVLVNGKRAEESFGKYKIKIKSGHHQVAVLAPGFHWITREVEIGTEPVDMELNPLSIFSGSCEHPKLNEILPSDVSVLAHFQDEQCGTLADKGRWKTLTASAPAQLKPQYTPSSNIQSDYRPSSEKSSIFTSPWFWVGVGALAGGIYLLTQNGKKERVVVPTHGFQF